MRIGTAGWSIPMILELAERRVRTGVWRHTTFREQPLARTRRTGLAAMTTDKSLTAKRNVVLLRRRSPPNAALA